MAAVSISRPPYSERNPTKSVCALASRHASTQSVRLACGYRGYAPAQHLSECKQKSLSLRIDYRTAKSPLYSDKFEDCVRTGQARLVMGEKCDLSK